MLNKEKLLSGVYGLAVGDALGVPVEFCNREMLDRDPVKGMEAGGIGRKKVHGAMIQVWYWLQWML